MKVKKATLQSFCKTLGIPVSGTIQLLSTRICNELCGSKKQQSVITSLRVLAEKKQFDKLESIFSFVEDLASEDVELARIVSQTQKKFGVKVNKIDMEVLLEVLDAHHKKDYSFIEEKIEQWGRQAEWGLKLARSYGEIHKASKLLEVL